MLARLRCGEVIDLQEQAKGVDRGGHSDRFTGLVISAAQITQLVLADFGPATREGPAVLHIRGAHITGGLDLRHASIRVPLVLESCVFDEPVDLSHAHAPTLSFQDSKLSALAASDWFGRALNEESYGGGRRRGEEIDINGGGGYERTERRCAAMCTSNPIR